ncbi:MAG: FMN-binding protein [Planctomycetota bacterium]
MSTDHKNSHSSPSLLRKIILYAGVLTGVCVASGAGVSALYVSSRDRIRQNRLRTFKESLSVVMEGAREPRPLGNDGELAQADVILAPRNDGVRYVGRASERGYQSVITVLVALDAEGEETDLPDNPTIQKVAVLDSAETPGLGENINKVERDISLWGAIAGYGTDKDNGSERPSFQEQFSGKRLKDLRINTSDEEAISPVTGATITSTATTKAVRKAVKKIIQRTEEINE